MFMLVFKENRILYYIYSIFHILYIYYISYFILYFIFISVRIVLIEDLREE